jgi:hypothetical protein
MANSSKGLEINLDKTLVSLATRQRGNDLARPRIGLSL